MRQECRTAVEAAARAAGRSAPTDRQVQAIDDQISAAMRRLARAEPARWQTMTREQRVEAAAQSVMADIKDAAGRKFDNAQRQILRTAETEQRIQSLMASFDGSKGHDGTRAEALKRDFELTHITTAAERKIAQGNMAALIEAAGDETGAGIGRRWLMRVFDAENPVMTPDIVREVFKGADGSTGNAAARGAARAWLDTVEGLRARFNSAGGDVGRLEYGYTPQPHDTARVRKAGAEAWIERTMPLLDRGRYLSEDGARLGDAEVRQFLASAYDTLRSEGLNKAEPGAFQGTGARANRGSDSRQIHFADGDAWLQYMREFGRGSI